MCCSGGGGETGGSLVVCIDQRPSCAPALDSWGSVYARWRTVQSAWCHMPSLSDWGLMFASCCTCGPPSSCCHPALCVASPQVDDLRGAVLAVSPDTKAGRIGFKVRDGVGVWVLGFC